MVVVLEVAMHMRRAKKKKKMAAHHSLSLTNLLSLKSNVAFLLYTLVEGVPHHSLSKRGYRPL